MKDKSNSKESVKSPADSLGDTKANAGGMPPTWSVEKTFAENEPPNRPAGNALDNMGSSKTGNGK